MYGKQQIKCAFQQLQTQLLIKFKLKYRMDDYEFHERQIDESMAKYRKNRDKDLYKKIKHQLDMYYLFLDQNFAAEEKYRYHGDQLKLLNELKREKDDIANKHMPSPTSNARKSLIDKPPPENVGMEYARHLEDEVKKELDKVQAGTERAIEISTYIKLELHRQIEVLGDMYQQNIDIDNRLNRVKKGLIVILRRAMMNKCTRFLAVLLVLVVIGLIVVMILKNNGSI